MAVHKCGKLSSAATFVNFSRWPELPHCSTGASLRGCAPQPPGSPRDRGRIGLGGTAVQ